MPSAGSNPARETPPYDMNWTTPENALGHLRSGLRVFVGSGCATPQKLVAALAARGPDVFDVEIVHILTFGDAPYSKRELLANYRHNAFFIGPNVREAVNEGFADYTPIFLSEIDRKSTRLNSSHSDRSRMPSSA